MNLDRRNGKVVVSDRLKNRLFFVGGRVNEYGEPDHLYP